MKRIRATGKIPFGWGLYTYNSRFKIDILKRIKTDLKNRDSLKILDVGCGKGIAMHELNTALIKKGIHENVKIFGIDRIKQNDNYSFNFKKINLMKYKSNHTFRFIFSHEAFQYMSDPITGLKRIYEHLEPNGEAYLTLRLNRIKIHNGKKYISLLDMLPDPSTPITFTPQGKTLTKIGLVSKDEYALKLYRYQFMTPKLLPALLPAIFPLKHRSTETGRMGEPISTYDLIR